MKARASEDNFQKATKQYFDAVLAPLGAIYAHSENERKCSPAQGAKRKKKGVLAGMPDWLIWYRGRCIGIELKTPTKASKLNAAQIEFRKNFEANGFKYFVCRTWAEVDLALSVIGVDAKRAA